MTTHDTDELTLETLTDTLTREEVEERMEQLDFTLQRAVSNGQIAAMFPIARERRLAAAYLALLDRHEEALALLSDDDVICSLRELADRDRSHSGQADPGKPLRELSDRIEECLRRVGGEE